MRRDKLQAIIEAIQKVRESADDETAVKAKDIYPEWRTETAYEVGDRVLYGETLYKCLQAHTSQDTWTPDTAVSLWAVVLIPDQEVTPKWVQPESTNPYMKGDKVKHNGKTWVSDVDGNVWEPGVYGWSEVA